MRTSKPKGGARPGAGRPELPPHLRRSIALKVYVSPQEEPYAAAMGGLRTLLDLAIATRPCTGCGTAYAKCDRSRDPWGHGCCPECNHPEPPTNEGGNT